MRRRLGLGLAILLAPATWDAVVSWARYRAARRSHARAHREAGDVFTTLGLEPVRVVQGRMRVTRQHHGWLEGMWD